MKTQTKKTVIIISAIVFILIIITLIFFLTRLLASRNSLESNEEIGSPENLQFTQKDLSKLVDNINKLNSNFKEENYGDQVYELDNGITCLKYIGNNYKEVISALYEVYSNPFVANGIFKNVNSENGNNYLAICSAQICDIGEIKAYKIDEKSSNYARVYLNDYAYEVIYNDGKYQLSSPVMLCKNEE